MQSLSGAAPPGELVQVCFPGAQSSLLDSLNVQREDRQLCDLSIVVQGQVYRAHRCVLAAASPYFHDQVRACACVCVCVCVCHPTKQRPPLFYAADCLQFRF